MIIETDHKPLVNLFHKSLNDCLLRIQRLMIRLQIYTLNVSYTPGKFMHTADALSRATDPNEVQSSTEEDVQVYVNMGTSNMPISSDRMDQIRCETEKSLKSVIDVIKKGWPPTKDACDMSVHEYWNCREELSVIDGIIYKGRKIVIPTSVRKLILVQIQQGHLGMEKCKKRTREVVYWPRINADITELVSHCRTCLKYKPQHQAEPLIPHESPSRAWQKVGNDLFKWDGKNYIVVTDYYLDFFEVKCLIAVNSRSVITCLKDIFARHGIPDELFSDNGP